MNWNIRSKSKSPLCTVASVVMLKNAHIIDAHAGIPDAHARDSIAQFDVSRALARDIVARISISRLAAILSFSCIAMDGKVLCAAYCCLRTDESPC